MKTFKVIVDGQTFNVQVEELTENKLAKNIERKDTGTRTASSGNNPEAINVPAGEHQNETVKPGVGGGASIKAPMPGSVIDVKVKEGDTVNDGDVLLVLEAMKMENELTASQSGTVKQVLVKKGDTVNSGDPLIILS